ncbi:MAG: orotate phosphoribosyltransferase [Thermaerobacter sp.]|nr:orotate phosphoribosyltransferase [Thermaerobacter sp.]
MAAGTLDDLREIGAYLTGHFRLTTGLHSDRVFLLTRLTEHPQRLEAWARLLADGLVRYGARTVVGPAVGGMLPGYAVARQWPNSRILFAEPGDDGSMRLRRGFRLDRGEPVVVVTDAVTAGDSAAQTVQAVIEAGGEVRAVGTLVDRSGGLVGWGAMGFVPVLRVAKDPAWNPEECPLCVKGIPWQHSPQ